jgi:hypothetical protein
VWLNKRLELALQGGWESVAGHRAYRIFGLTLQPRHCVYCQRTF